MGALSSEFEPKPRQSKWGPLLLQALILVFFLVFLVRLWHLQINKGEAYAEKARNNQIKTTLIHAPRGTIRDAKGAFLAINEPAYALVLIKENCEDVTKTVQALAGWTGIPAWKFLERIEQVKGHVRPFEPIVLISSVSPELVAVIEANALYWPGLEIVSRTKRYYPDGPMFAHILGYVAEASEDDLAKDKASDSGEQGKELAMGDHIGKQGIEFTLEQNLRGIKGLDYIEVDATGRILNRQHAISPLAGEDVFLSIDSGLQRFATKQLEAEDHVGSIVVMDPDTGRILALVSRPAFDNNAFTSGLSQAQWAELRDDPRHPMQNRAVQSVYPPGSVWKLVMAAAAFNAGMLNPNETVFCPGHYTFANRTFRCWKKGGHGSVNLRQALIGSCDVYFYRLGERLKVDRIHDFANKVGFGVLNGIELPNEKPGLIPSREWKLQRFKEPWHGGENLNLAIGQGYAQTSPLQIARFVAALINGGNLMRPTLLRDVEPEVSAKLPITDAQRQLIADTMVDTVEFGTARRIKYPGAIVGGKTGTAQVVKLTAEHQGRDVKNIPYKFRDHAWMASFGEKDGKRYVIVGMVEHGGGGSSTVGPLLRPIYGYLFGGPESAEAQALEQNVHTGDPIEEE